MKKNFFLCSIHQKYKSCFKFNSNQTLAQFWAKNRKILRISRIMNQYSVFFFLCVEFLSIPIIIICSWDFIEIYHKNCHTVKNSWNPYSFFLLYDKNPTVNQLRTIQTFWILFWSSKTSQNSNIPSKQIMIFSIVPLKLLPTSLNSIISCVLRTCSHWSHIGTSTPYYSHSINFDYAAQLHHYITQKNNKT